MSSLFPLSPPAHSFSIGPTVINIHASEFTALSVEVVDKGSCAGVLAADGTKWPASSSGTRGLCDADTELSGADAELSDAEHDDFWRSVEHLNAIPIAFEMLL